MRCRKARKGLVLEFMGVILLAPTLGVCAQNVDTAKVRKVKAAYLFNFAKFVDWPKEALGPEDGEFVICVLGDDEMGRILESTLKSKRLASRSIVIRRHQPMFNKTDSSLQECQLVYVGKSLKSQLQFILQPLKNQPILLVSEISNFARRGGMIGFVLEKGRIVFEINRRILIGAGLRASSKLLSLARLVTERKR